MEKPPFGAPGGYPLDQPLASHLRNWAVDEASHPAPARGTLAVGAHRAPAANSELSEPLAKHLMGGARREERGVVEPSLAAHLGGNRDHRIASIAGASPRIARIEGSSHLVWTRPAVARYRQARCPSDSRLGASTRCSPASGRTPRTCVRSSSSPSGRPGGILAATATKAAHRASSLSPSGRATLAQSAAPRASRYEAYRTPRVRPSGIRAGSTPRARPPSAPSGTSGTPVKPKLYGRCLRGGPSAGLRGHPARGKSRSPRRPPRSREVRPRPIFPYRGRRRRPPFPQATPGLYSLRIQMRSTRRISRFLSTITGPSSEDSRRSSRTRATTFPTSS